MYDVFKPAGQPNTTTRTSLNLCTELIMVRLIFPVELQLFGIIYQIT